MNFHLFTASVSFKVCLDATSILFIPPEEHFNFISFLSWAISNGTSFTYGKPVMWHFILAGLYFNRNFIPHGNFFIHLWVLFHSLPTALSYNISFMYGRYFIVTSIPCGNLIILPWTLFHSSLVLLHVIFHSPTAGTSLQLQSLMEISSSSLVIYFIPPQR